MREADRGAVLLAIARESIERGEPLRSFAWEAEWLRAHGASFVTLRLEGELRGCIGTIDAHRPLGDDVARNARADSAAWLFCHDVRRRLAIAQSGSSAAPAPRKSSRVTPAAGTGNSMRDSTSSTSRERPS